MIGVLRTKLESNRPLAAAAIVCLAVGSLSYIVGRAVLLSRPVIAVAECTIIEPLIDADGAPTKSQLQSLERWLTVQAADHPPGIDVLERDWKHAAPQVQHGPSTSACPGLSSSVEGECPPSRDSGDTRNTSWQSNPPALDGFDSNLLNGYDQLLREHSVTANRANQSEAKPTADVSAPADTVADNAPSEITDLHSVSSAARADYCASDHTIVVGLTARSAQAEAAKRAVETTAERFANFVQTRWRRQLSEASRRAAEELDIAQRCLAAARERLREAERKLASNVPPSDQPGDLNPEIAPSLLRQSPSGNVELRETPTPSAALSSGDPKAAPDNSDEQSLPLGRRIELLKLRRAALLGVFSLNNSAIEQLDRELAVLESQASSHSNDIATMWLVPQQAATVVATTPSDQAQHTSPQQSPLDAPPAESSAAEHVAIDPSAEHAAALAAAAEAEKRFEQAELRLQKCRLAERNPPQLLVGPISVRDPAAVLRVLAGWPLAALTTGIALMAGTAVFFARSRRLLNWRSDVVIQTVEQLQQAQPLPVVGTVVVH